PPRRGYYVRPCLCLTRSDTEVYCAALGQNYVQDETNEQNTYARNRIRHDAIPALQYANPSAEVAIARLCRQIRDLDQWLTGRQLHFCRRPPWRMDTRYPFFVRQMALCWTRHCIHW